jgi:cell division protein FtsL
MQGRIERVASTQLNMRAVSPSRIQMLVPGAQVAAK